MGIHVLSSEVSEAGCVCVCVCVCVYKYSYSLSLEPKQESNSTLNFSCYTTRSRGDRFSGLVINLSVIKRCR